MPNKNTNTFKIHPDEENSEIALKREEAGLEYIGDNLLEGTLPRLTCFYDERVLFPESRIGSKKLWHKICYECGVEYHLPSVNSYI